MRRSNGTHSKRNTKAPAISAHRPEQSDSREHQDLPPSPEAHIRDGADTPTPSPYDTVPRLRLLLVRSAETSPNRQRLLSGQIDPPLTQVGRRQAEMIGDTFKNLRFDRAFSSNLIRAVETASIILTKQDSPPELEQHELLRERDLRECAGVERKQLPAEALQHYQEPSEVLVRRINTFFLYLMKKYGMPNSLLGSPTDGTRDILVVSHGIWIAKTCKLAMHEQGYRPLPAILMSGRVGVGSITVVEIYSGGVGDISLYGDVRHLSIEWRTHDHDFTEINEQDL